MSSSSFSRPRLTAMVPADPAQKKELSLELGLSVWMQRNGIAFDDCRAAMLAMRASLLEVAGMDTKTEPVPLYGRSPEVDLKNFAAYLADLFIRASEAVECELPLVIGRVSEHLAS
jgi:hypothetical protein